LFLFIDKLIIHPGFQFYRSYVYPSCREWNARGIMFQHSGCWLSGANPLY